MIHPNSTGHSASDALHESIQHPAWKASSVFVVQASASVCKHSVDNVRMEPVLVPGQERGFQFGLDQ